MPKYRRKGKGAGPAHEKTEPEIERLRELFRKIEDERKQKPADAADRADEPDEPGF